MAEVLSNYLSCCWSTGLFVKLLLGYTSGLNLACTWDQSWPLRCWEQTLKQHYNWRDVIEIANVLGPIFSSRSKMQQISLKAFFPNITIINNDVPSNHHNPKDLNNNNNNTKPQQTEHQQQVPTSNQLLELRVAFSYLVTKTYIRLNIVFR